MIRRILNFKKEDWKHIFWLFRNMIKQSVLFEWSEAQEAALLIWVHLKYDSNRIE